MSNTNTPPLPPQYQIDTCDALLSQLTDLASIKFNSNIHPHTTQIMSGNPTTIGGLVIEGVADATDEYIKQIRSLIAHHKRVQQQILDNQVIN